MNQLKQLNKLIKGYEKEVGNVINGVHQVCGEYGFGLCRTTPNILVDFVIRDEVKDMKISNNEYFYSVTDKLCGIEYNLDCIEVRLTYLYLLRELITN